MNADPVIPTEPQGQEAATTPEWFSIYGHGFHNGVYKIAEEVDSFPGFLNYSNELEKATELQKLNSIEVEQHTQNLRAAEETFSRCTSEAIASERKIETLNFKLAQVQSSNATIQIRNKQLFDKRDHIFPEYGWIPALLFFVAGVLFILADISVTEDIAYNGFDMPKREGRLFAIGLAFTVFLIKPLLDRMFEKPFQKAGYELKRVYKVVLFMITGFALIMLLLLGHFRSDAKLSKLEKAQYSSILSSDRASDIDKDNARLQVGKLSNALGQNWWGRWGIVLSTLIFAIGGAMCLAVAFPSLTHLSNRYWFIPFRRWLNKFLIRKNDQQLSLLTAEMNDHKVIVDNAQTKLKGIDLPTIQSLLSTAKAMQVELLTTYYQVRQQKENELYTDGYNRGNIYSLEGDLKFKVLDPMTMDNNRRSEANGQSPADNETRKYNRRPFVKIRKMIADNYNKKQNTSTQDGTEFEILS